MIVCIPNHEKLTDSQVEFVVDKIKDYDKFSPLRKKELND